MAELQCHIRGGLLPPKVEGHAVQFGKQEITMRQKECEIQLCSSHASPSSKPIYSCKRTDEAVRSITHSTVDSFDLTHILTTKGALCVFYTKEGDHDSTPALLQEWQLATEVTSVVTAHSSAAPHEVQFFVGCFDGVYGEVVLVSLTFTVQTPATTALSGSLDARGVFRIKGRLSQLLWQTDAEESLLLSVSQDGNIDVWDWKLERDVTQHFGGISWDAAVHGAPCDGGALLHESKLWLPTNRGAILVFPFIRGQTVSKALLLDAHSGPVRQLLLMSGGRHIWSYAEGGRVSVWDTDSISFKGSFLFPDCRIADLVCADQQLVTHLWAVDGETGGLASLVVNESLQNFTGKLFVSNEEVQQARKDRLSVGQLDGMLNTVSRDLLVLGFNCFDSVVPDGLGDVVRRVETLVEMVRDYGASTALLRLFFSDDDTSGRFAKTEVNQESLESMLTCLTAECRRAAAIDDDIQHFCSSVCALIGEPRDLTSLEDILEALGDWQDALRSQNAKGDVELAGDDTFAAKDVTVAMEKELQEKDLYAAELDKRIVELLHEQRDLSTQLERAQQSLSDRDQQIAVLQRTADAAKKAAELASADTAQLFELESCLHTTREKEAQLEAELEQLRAKADVYRQSEECIFELEQKISSYETKEKLAVHAIEDFISVQNSLFEEVSALVDWLSSTDIADSPAAILATGSSNAFVDECRDKLLLLETHFTEKVSQQKKYFSLLRSEYGTTVH